MSGRKKKSKAFPARKENFISHRSFSPGLFRRADLTRGREKRRDVGGGHGSFPSIDSWQGANGTRPAAKHLRAIPASKRRFTPFRLGISNLSRFYKPFNISPVFRSPNTSRSHSLPFLEKRHLLATSSFFRDKETFENFSRIFSFHLLFLG